MPKYRLGRIVILVALILALLPGQPVAASSVNVSPAHITVKPGGTSTLTVSVADSGSSYHIKAVSSNPAVASVVNGTGVSRDGSSPKFTIKAHAAGSARITISGTYLKVESSSLVPKAFAARTVTVTVASAATPTPKPSATPTPRPTSQPTIKPTLRPTAAPTRRPTPKPSATPTPRPTRAATPAPTPRVTRQQTIASEIDAVTYSTDLASLAVSPGIMTPAFLAEVTDYSVVVPSDADSVEIDARAVDDQVEVKGVGNIPITADPMTHRIVVEARNGFQTVYTLNISREKAKGILRDGKTYLPAPIVENETFQGLAQLSLQLDGQELTGFGMIGPAALRILKLIDEAEQVGYYRLTATEQLVPLIPVTFNQTTCYLLGQEGLEPPQPALLPRQVTFDGQDVGGWCFEQAELDHVTVFPLLLPDGTTADYLWDRDTGGFIRLPKAQQLVQQLLFMQQLATSPTASEAPVTVTAIPETSPAPESSLAAGASGGTPRESQFMIWAGILTVVSIAVLSAVISHLRRKQRDTAAHVPPATQDHLPHQPAEPSPQPPADDFSDHADPDAPPRGTPGADKTPDQPLDEL